MRKLTLVLTLLASTFIAGVAGAQVNDRFFFAADFNKWSLQGQNSIYTFNAATSCIVNPYNSSSYTFATTAPVYVQDFGTPANSETVTPATVTSASGTCGFTGTFSHSHPNFQVQSGTAGLQEAINAAKGGSATHPFAVILDTAWYNGVTAIGGTAATLIGAATGSTSVTLVDTTQIPWTVYSWVSSAYLKNGVLQSSGAPSGACAAGAVDTRTDATGGLYVCVNGTWTAVTIP